MPLPQAMYISEQQIMLQGDLLHTRIQSLMLARQGQPCQASTVPMVVTDDKI